MASATSREEFAELPASGSCQRGNVLHVQILFGVALANTVDHGARYLPQGTKARRVKRRPMG